MRPTISLLFLLAVPVISSSWFSSDEESAASKWTEEQYRSAQKSFQNLKDTSFDTWSDSRLRQFLLEHGIVEPSGPRESLVLAAKGHYKAYTDAASSFSSQATNTFTDAAHSASSYVAQATAETYRQAEAGKDYVYSTWDDSKLHDYLVKKGYMQSKEQKKRDEMLAMMHDAYVSITNPVWKAWSDSYIHGWLVEHGIIKSDYQKRRDDLVAKMEEYYYDVSDSVWSTWSESDMKKWLVDHDVIKSDAQIKKEKMVKLIEAHYPTAPSTIYKSWKTSDMHAWLVDNGYLRSDAQVKRDELIKLMHAKYNGAASTAAPYLTWPESRLRAYLVEHGLVSPPPSTREALLQRVRATWVDPPRKSIMDRLRDVLYGGAEAAEEKLSQVRAILEEKSGYVVGALILLAAGALWMRSDANREGVLGKAGERGEYVKAKAGEGGEYVRAKAGEEGEYVKEKASEGAEWANEQASEKASVGGDYVRAKASEGAAYVWEKTAQSTDYVKGKAAEGQNYAGRKTQEGKERKVKQGGEKLKGEL